MTPLPPSVLDDLRLARVPWVAGMLPIVADDGSVMGRVEDGEEVPAHWVPDPLDRATFLLLLDEAERRDIASVELHDAAGRLALPLEAVRSVHLWQGRWRDPALAALARALRETAPDRASDTAPDRAPPSSDSTQVPTVREFPCCACPTGYECACACHGAPRLTVREIVDRKRHLGPDPADVAEGIERRRIP